MLKKLQLICKEKRIETASLHGGIEIKTIRKDVD
jgi:hypothetical protein